jgi:O-antigen/teichoic acid export membrane protein
VAVRVVDVVVLAPRILATAVYPQLRKAREGGTAETVGLMVDGTKVTLVLCSALALAVWGLAPVAVGLIGGKGYEASVPALQILAWAVALQAGCHMMVRLLFAAEREKDLLPVGALGILCNVVLNALWIPRLGIEGAALATVVSYGVTLALYYLFAARAGYRVPLWSSSGGALLSLALAAAVAQALPVEGPASRAGAAAATWVVSLALLRVTGPAQLREGLARLRRRP